MYFQSIFKCMTLESLPMHLTRFTDYTLRVLLFLGGRGTDERLATIGDIAVAYGISENHLRKVVHHLARAGYIKTTRGKGGGMELAHAPERINLGEVVRATEENHGLVACISDGKPTCVILPVCNLPRIFAAASRAFFTEIDKYTLADAAHPPDRLAQILLAPPPQH